jgi:thioredoxin 1
MKRILLSLITSFCCFVNAEIGKDQIAQLSLCLQVPYGKGLQICQEQGFSHFVFKSISYSDEKGQTLTFEGSANDDKGQIISDTIELNLTPEFGKQTIKFDLLCYKEAPENPLAVDVKGTNEFIAMLENQQSEPSTEVSQVREITSFKDLKNEITNAKGPLFVDCYSTKCPPCKMLTPKYDQFSVDLASKGTFLKVNINDVPEIGPEYGIQAIPTLIVFKNQKENTRKSGLPEILKYFEDLKK